MLSHHAYYVEDSLSMRDAYQNGIRASEGFELDDPGFVARRYEKFGIDEARELIALASLKSVGGRALFFVAAASITSEAQQALLKLLEEPQEGTVFVLLVPHGALMATLRSRMLEYKVDVVERAEHEEARRFLAMPYAKRSEWIVAFLKDEDDSRERARDFFTGLEAELYKKIGTSRDIREGLEDVAHFRQYLADRSPSLKMILEHFAATLPKIA